jgi:hypothetical protein
MYSKILLTSILSLVSKIFTGFRLAKHIKSVCAFLCICISYNLESTHICCANEIYCDSNRRTYCMSLTEIVQCTLYSSWCLDGFIVSSEHPLIRLPDKYKHVLGLHAILQRRGVKILRIKK